MVELRVGQTIRVYTAVWDFCGELGNNAIYISDVLVDTIPSLDPVVTCQDISGLTIEFRLVTSGDILCKGCNPEVVYSTWGTANTNGQGLAYIDHVVTDSDLAAYQAAASSGNYVKVLACITGAKGQTVLSNKCSAPVTVVTATAPTHYVQFKLGFVPPEVMDIFDQYITQISNGIMTQITHPPSPWVYVKTTYDRVENAFRIWLSLPSGHVVTTMSLMDDIIFWISNIWKSIIGAILIILALVYPPAAAYAMILIVAGVIAIAWNFVDLVTGLKEAEQIAKNLDIQVNINNNFDKGKSALNDEWEKSAKTQSDCTVRLGRYRDFYLTSILNSYSEKYSKYADLSNALKSEKTSFLSVANSIINKVGTDPYSVDVCNTYYTQLDSAVNASKVRIDEIVSRYIVPDQTYAVACKGWSNQGDCEKAECFWYDGSCHKDEACWIPNGIGGCILSAGTGKVIVGTAIALTLLGITYWAVTRKPAETKIVIEGAKQVAAKGTEIAKAEYGRMKTAYTQIRVPQVPKTAPKVPVIPRQTTF